MAGKMRTTVWLLLIAMLTSSCSYMPSFMKKPWGGGGKDVELPDQFSELKPGRSVGLKKNWIRGVEGEADDHMNHPERIAVTADSIFLGTYDGKVVRIARDNGRILWREDVKSSVSGGVAVDAQRVFAGTVEGEMIAISRESGERIWTATVSTKVASAPVVADGKVIFTTLNNRAYALDVNTGDRLWTHNTAPVALVVKGAATPTVDGHTVYIGYSTGEVFALNLQDGKVLWGEDLSRLSGHSELDRLQDVDAEVVVGERSMNNRFAMIYTVNHQGYVMALHPAKGTPFWKRQFSSIRRPLLWGNRLFISNIDGQIVSMSASDGMEVWRMKVTDGILSAPVMLGDQIIVGDSKGNIISMDPTSGRVIGLDKIKDAILADPVVDGNNLFIWTNDGDLFNYSM